MKRPTVTLSYAQSLDGSISAERGRPMRLSGPEAHTMTHQLRAEHDAILVGIGTVLSDDPRLTVRRVTGRNPQPIVLDSRLRCSPSANLIANRAWIATTVAADPTCFAALQAAGACIKQLPASADGLVALPALLHWLHEEGVRTLMVEGGAKIIHSFLQHQLVDRVILTISPQFVGGYKALANPLPYTRLTNIVVHTLGDDIIIDGTL